MKRVVSHSIIKFAKDFLTRSAAECFRFSATLTRRVRNESEIKSAPQALDAKCSSGTCGFLSRVDCKLRRNRRDRNGKDRSVCATSSQTEALSRFSNKRGFKLLDLEEIVELKEYDDLTYTLKVIAGAFKMATEFVTAEYGDSELSSDVLILCEQNIRRKYTIGVMAINATGGGSALVHGDVK